MLELDDLNTGTSQIAMSMNPWNAHVPLIFFLGGGRHSFAAPRRSKNLGGYPGSFPGSLAKESI